MNYRSERHAALEQSFPSCSGPCNQGRGKCSTPQACEKWEPVPDGEAIWMLLPFFCIFCAAVAVAIMVLT